MLRAASVLWLLMISPAWAWSYCSPHLGPPAKFDYEPTAAYDVQEWPQEDIQWLCHPRGLFGAQKARLGGCMKVAGQEKYWILIRNDLTPGEQACVVRHEKAHVNGWRHGSSWWPFRSSLAYEPVP